MDSTLTQDNSGQAAARYELGLETRSPALNGGPVISITHKRHSRVDGRTSRGPSSLVQRSISVGSRRTTVRLEPAMWEALGEICQREGANLNDLCSRIANRRNASSLTATIRVFVMSYFRAAATEEGHARTGHGLLFGEDRPISRSYRKPEGAQRC